MGLKEYLAHQKKRKALYRKILLGKSENPERDRLFDPDGVRFFLQYLKDILYDDKLPIEIDQEWRKNKWLVGRFQSSIMRGLLNKRPDFLKKLQVKFIEISKDYLELKRFNSNLTLEKKNEILALMEKFINYVSYSETILSCLDIRMENLMFEISKVYFKFKNCLDGCFYVLPLFLVPFVQFCERYKHYDENLENINLVDFERKFWYLIYSLSLPEFEFFKEKKKRQEETLKIMRAKRYQ